MIEKKISSFGYHPRWSADGKKILFYSNLLQYNTVEIPKLYVVGLDEQTSHEVLSSFLTEFSVLYAAWHPDGQQLSIWGNHKKEGWSFWTAPLAGNTPTKSSLSATVEKRFKEADVELQNFQWASNGNALYFEGVTHGVRNIWKISVDAESLHWRAGPERLTTNSGFDTDVTISRDGQKLAFAARTKRTRLLSIPFEAATGKIGGEGKPLTASDVRAIHPDFSADGKKLAYIAEQAGKQEIRERLLANGQERVLYAADGLVLAYPRWSPDGKFLVYRRVRSSHERINAILPVDGGDERALTSPTPNGELTWEWSPDGKWILAGSQRQTNDRFAICLFPISAAPHAETEMRVIASSASENLYQGRFSPDQRWISFIAANAVNAGISNINIVAAQGGDWIRISDGKYFDDKPRWSPDGRILYFMSNRTGFFNVWGIHIDPATAHPQGEPFRVTTFENPSQMIMTDVRIMDMALTANQLMLPITETSGGIWILENVE